MDGGSFATREEIWRLQSAIDGLSTTQTQHAERIMRLEKRTEDGGRSKSLWGPSSPFPSGLSSSQTESTLNPAAEAFRNFDNDTPGGMISSLTLDTSDESRRAASRAASVRFDESANNYAPSRQSIDLPTRTGSGLGGHPLSERSLSHRSDGRGSTVGFGRANSFGLENSRLLGSIHNSPRVSGNPPPGLFALGPCPAIVRCWLTETFTNDTLLYAAVCTGAAVSSIGIQTLHNLGLDNSIIEENGLRKIRLLVYLTEAKIQIPSSRSASPSPQVPTVTAKFVVDERPSADKSIQIVLGSDILRQQSADLLLSQDKLVIFDDDRNQLSVPLVRPEDDNVYRHLVTKARSRSGSSTSEVVPSDLVSEISAPGIIGRPSRLSSVTSPASPLTEVVNGSIPPEPSDTHQIEEARQILTRSVTDLQNRPSEDSKSGTESERSTTTTPSKSSSGVWSSSWRSAAAGVPTSQKPADPQSSTAFTRHGAPRPMKVLRPNKSMANVTRNASSPSTPTTANAIDTQPVQTESSIQSPTEKGPVPTRTNPIGSGSAFGWLNSGASRRTTTSGGP
ncbi:hypothetical protein LTR64_002783 [Lithohypha guttulata]|uniref:Ubiquitin carboxyl-terminal hydrolase 19 n=1 Tax=Lithohypha guttulata TaxID=1690604 RepID=A0AAN7SX79_9EURO|nr:hypothetical protein LTR51_000992 [Lithohypha guttulata]KAK5083859.1 hypothetical protein LTR05_006366 [Lithohypha guttulata]